MRLDVEAKVEDEVRGDRGMRPAGRRGHRDPTGEELVAVAVGVGEVGEKGVELGGLMRGSKGMVVGMEIGLLG